MLDDFFFRAVIGGVGVALLAGPLGCFIVWRRLAYFGDTLSHSALLGVALALLFELNVTLSVFAISVVVSLLLMLLQRRAALSSDTLLGLLAHSALAVGLVVLAFMTWVRVDLMGFLFGNIFAMSWMDVILTGAAAMGGIAVLAAVWQPMLRIAVSPELAAAEARYLYLGDILEALRAAGDFSLMLDPDFADAWFQDVEAFFAARGLPLGRK